MKVNEFYQNKNKARLLKTEKKERIKSKKKKSVHYFKCASRGIAHSLTIMRNHGSMVSHDTKIPTVQKPNLKSWEAVL